MDKNNEHFWYEVGLVVFMMGAMPAVVVLMAMGFDNEDAFAYGMEYGFMSTLLPVLALAILFAAIHTLMISATDKVESTASGVHHLYSDADTAVTPSHQLAPQENYDRPVLST